MRARGGGVNIERHSVSTSNLDGSEAVIVTLRPLYLREGNPLTIEGEVRSASESGWICFKMRNFMLQPGFKLRSLDSVAYRCNKGVAPIPGLAVGSKLLTINVNIHIRRLKMVLYS